MFSVLVYFYLCIYYIDIYIYVIIEYSQNPKPLFKKKGKQFSKKTSNPLPCGGGGGGYEVIVDDSRHRHEATATRQASSQSH